MKLFGINFGGKKKETPKFLITTSDRKWVDSNFQWLIDVFGNSCTDQLLLTEEYFPITFSSANLKIENLINDCCNQLKLDSNLFSYEVYEDIRDTTNMPYAVAGKLKDSNLEYDERTGKYTFYLAKSIFKYTNWLAASICYEFAKAKLINSKIEYDIGADTNYFQYLAAVYYGYGVIISQNLFEIGFSANSEWVKRWSYSAEIPYPVIAYSLAIFSHINKNYEPVWKELLSLEIRTEFELTLDYIHNNDYDISTSLTIEDSLSCSELILLAYNQYRSKEIAKAISTLNDALLIAKDKMHKSHIYNNIGYYKVMSGEYESSINDFKLSIKYNPNYGYANDNLAFALIMTDNPDEGKKYLAKAINTENNDKAYSNRNMALYYQKKGNFNLAEEYFQKAFEMKTKVDLLSFVYGQFLILRGEKEEGLKHIKISAELGEIIAINYLKKNSEYLPI